MMTGDTFTGGETRVVIYDLVITCNDSSYGLEIVANEFSANTVVTRATEQADNSRQSRTRQYLSIV